MTDTPPEFDERVLSTGGMNEIETFYGLVETTSDALRIAELCRQGKLGRVSRRLHEKERRLIRSGSVFVFDELESGIRRWTDGRIWSPSRILGNFLIYRELERRPSGGSTESLLTAPHEDFEDGSFQLSSDAELAGLLPWLSEPMVRNDTLKDEPASEEELGDMEVLQSKKLLTNHKGRFAFKSGGLIKKTISVKIDGHPHHLICYYDKRDFCQGHLGDKPNASQMSNFNWKLLEEIRKVKVPQEIVAQQRFRKPVNMYPDLNRQMITAQEADQVKKPAPKRRSSFPGAIPMKQHRVFEGFVPIAPAINESNTSLSDPVFPFSSSHVSFPAAESVDPNINIEMMSNSNIMENSVKDTNRFQDPESPSNYMYGSLLDLPEEGSEDQKVDLTSNVLPGMKWDNWLQSPTFKNDQDLGSMDSPVFREDPMLASLRPPSTLFDVNRSPNFEF